MYQITAYTKKRADEIGVVVKPSQKKNKKIDVYKDNVFLASLGEYGAKDFPTYSKEDGKEYAEERRRLYHIRHTKKTLGELLSRWLLW